MEERGGKEGGKEISVKELAEGEGREEKEWEKKEGEGKEGRGEDVSEGRGKEDKMGERRAMLNSSFHTNTRSRTTRTEGGVDEGRGEGGEIGGEGGERRGRELPSKAICISSSDQRVGPLSPAFFVNCTKHNRVQ